MPSVETGLLGGRVPCIRGGSGERTAVVFYGVSALYRRLDEAPDPERYARQIARLLPGYRFTILGYTGSSFDEVVRDMAMAIAEPVDALLGISFGGFVAMRFAAEYPEWARRIVLLASAHRFSAGGLRTIDRQVAALEQGDVQRLVREHARFFRRPWYNWLAQYHLWRKGERLTEGFRRHEEILRDYRQFFGPEFAHNAEYARRIAVPALVIGGTADQLFDEGAFEETASMIPGAQLRLFDGETHMLPIEKSGEVAAAIASR